MFARAAIRSRRASQKLTTIESMIAGAIAGSATVLITNPIWVINTRMTARIAESTSTLPSLAPTSKTRRKQSTIGTLLALFREEGPTALFAGVLPALVLVINPILQYTIFEQLKDALEKRRGNVLPRDAFFLGAIGKLLATSITYPYITIKSRMHVARGDGPQDTIIGSLKKIVREEGWAGLYKGMMNFFLLLLILLIFLLWGMIINPFAYHGHYGNRNWAQSHSKRDHSRFSLRVQRCSLCR